MTGTVNDTDDTARDRRHFLVRNMPLAIIGVVAALGYVFLRDFISFEALRDNRLVLLAFRDAHYWATVAGFIGIYVLIVAFSLPGAAVASLTGGFLFGVFPGTFFNVAAATTGAVVIFLAARMGLGEALSRRMEASDGALHAFQQGIRENEISYLFLMRLVPAVPFFLANLIPALLGVGLRNFALTTFLGIMPGALVYTWVGAGLGHVFEQGGTPELGIIFEWQILGPILALCTLAALPIVLRAVNGRND